MLNRLLLVGVGVGLMLAVLPATSGASPARGIAAAPAATPSFASEALWSSSDDWEPNVATDPSS